MVEWLRGDGGGVVERRWLGVGERRVRWVCG